MKHSNWRSLIAALVAPVVLGVVITEAGQTSRPARAPRPSAVRLYVFECATLQADVTRFGLQPNEVTTNNLIIQSFLVAHPKGALVWDTCAVADADWKPTGAPMAHRVVLPDKSQRDLTLIKRLQDQLTQVGYSPADVTHFALSHYHWDHTANASQFAGATWIVRQVERDAMFADPPPPVTLPSSYAALRNSKTVTLKTEDHDLFGDGTVVIKSAPGHTPGHQILYLKLAKTGGVVLSGDLYHFPQQRTLNRTATFDFDQAQTRKSRAIVEAFLKNTGAQLWITHDSTANLKKAPDYYE